MFAWIRRLLWDESAFERWGRVCIFAIGEGIRNGTVPVPPGWEKVGMALQALALLIAAGEKNVSTKGKVDNSVDASE